MEQVSTIVEINGVKMEIDLRTAKAVRVDTFKVGSRVKLLRKGYSNEYSVVVGVIVGFDQFKALPSIQVAYIDTGYSETPLKFFTFNASTKDAELILAEEDDLEFNRDQMTAALDRHVEQKRIELEKAQHSRELFKKHFGKAITVAEIEAETVGEQ